MKDINSMKDTEKKLKQFSEDLRVPDKADILGSVKSKEAPSSADDIVASGASAYTAKRKTWYRFVGIAAAFALCVGAASLALSGLGDDSPLSAPESSQPDSTQAMVSEPYSPPQSAYDLTSIFEIIDTNERDYVTLKLTTPNYSGTFEGITLVRTLADNKVVTYNISEIKQENDSVTIDWSDIQEAEATSECVYFTYSLEYQEARHDYLFRLAFLEGGGSELSLIGQNTGDKNHSSLSAIEKTSSNSGYMADGTFSINSISDLSDIAFTGNYYIEGIDENGKPSYLGDAPFAIGSGSGEPVQELTVDWSERYGEFAPNQTYRICFEVVQISDEASQSDSPEYSTRYYYFRTASEAQVTPPSFSIENATPKGLDLIIDNASDSEYCYGLPYHLLDNNGNEIAPTTELTFISLGCIVMPNETSTYSVDFTEFYGELAPGSYTIVFTEMFGCENNTLTLDFTVE